jgi:hypothetical protein
VVVAGEMNLDAVEAIPEECDELPVLVVRHGGASSGCRGDRAPLV